MLPDAAAAADGQCQEHWGGWGGGQGDDRNQV